MDVYLLEKLNCSTWAVLAKDESSALASLARPAEENLGVTLPADTLADSYKARIFNEPTDGKILDKQEDCITIKLKYYTKEYSVFNEPIALI